MLRTARYVVCWPRFLGWLFPLLAVACFFARDLRLLEDGVLAATWRDWWARRWRYSTTLAAGMVFHPSHLAHPSVEKHERVHLRQSEDLAIAGLALALVVGLATLSAWALLLWPFAFVLKAAGFLGALLRGGDAYRDAEHERSAYAQTDPTAPDGSSWLDEHERAR